MQRRGQSSFQCEDLTVEFGTGEAAHPVIAGVSFTVDHGEFVTIMGRSGSGKTTLLKVLGGLLTPTPDSAVLFQGEPVQGPPEGVVMVFQDYSSSLLPWRTVYRNAALGLERRIGEKELRERVHDALAMVGLDDRADDYPAQLSGGMQQRVQLARALAMRPSVLLMDEPFGALDAMTKAALEDDLLAVHEQTEATVVFVTHDADEAVYLSDRVLVLSGFPAKVTDQIPASCPRPRDQLTTKESEEFLRARHKVYDLIRSG